MPVYNVSLDGSAEIQVTAVDEPDAIRQAKLTLDPSGEVVFKSATVELVVAEVADSGLNWMDYDVAGSFSRWEIVQKYGKNAAVGTSLSKVCNGGIYTQPALADAFNARVKAGNAADASDGNNARTVKLWGVDNTGAARTCVLSTNGTSAGVADDVDWMRIYRGKVVTCGTHMVANAAAVVIEDSAGSADRFRIETGEGQSQSAAFCVPSGYEVFLESAHITVDTAKSTRVVLWTYGSILTAAAPFPSKHLRLDLAGLKQPYRFKPNRAVALDNLEALAPLDIWWEASVDTGTAEVSIDFELLLREPS